MISAQVLDVCETKPLRAFLFSRTYVGKLRGAMDSIKNGFLELAGAHAATTFEYQNQSRQALELVRGALARLPEKPVSQELQKAASTSARALVQTAQHYRISENEAWDQLRDLQRDYQALVADKHLVDKALLDAVCGLSLQQTIPEDFYCPIRKEVMRDPVLLHTDAGASYERAALEEQLKLNPFLDPMTGVRYLHRLKFAPNRALKNTIAAFFSTTSSAEGPPATPMTPMTVSEAAFALRSAGGSSKIARKLAEYCDNWDDANKVAGRPAIPVLVAMLAKDGEAASLALWKLARNKENTIDIINHGAIPGLVELLTQPGAREAAAGALRNLASKNIPAKDAIVEAGAIPKLVSLLKEDVNSKEKAASCLAHLALDHGKNKVAIAAAGALTPLLRLLSDEPKVQENAAAALKNLARMNATNQAAIADGIPALVKLLRNGTAVAKANAAGALQNLASNVSNKLKIARDADAFVKLLNTGTTEAKEAAAGALWALAVASENHAVLARAGAIPALRRLSSTGTPQAKANAAGALLFLANPSSDPPVPPRDYRTMSHQVPTQRSFLLRRSPSSSSSSRTHSCALQ